MTEDEAKTKWCPFGRVSTQTGNTTCNRIQDGGPHYGSLCIGSVCMAWRWIIPTYEGRYGQTETGDPPTQGYCGLGGKP